MSFRSIVRDIRDSFGSLSLRTLEVRIHGHHRGKSNGSVHGLQCEQPAMQIGPWASLPPELLRDVMKRLEASENTWPARKHVVACAAVCRSWRGICLEMVKSPEISGRLTFPLHLKMPGPQDGTIQCFIKRDKSNLTYYLSLCLTPALHIDTGKFLLSAKRTRRTTCTEYVISTCARNASRSCDNYIGKLRSNFLGTKFVIYDSQQQPHNSPLISASKRTSRRFSTRVSPKVSPGNYHVAQVTYELNVLGTRGPRRMHCVMHSIPASVLDPGGGTLPSTNVALPPSRPLDESFRSSSSATMESFSEMGSSRYLWESEGGGKEKALTLRNKAPRWHEQLQCWCLNFRGRVTVASVKNFQLIAAVEPSASRRGQSGQQGGSVTEQEKILLQFGKVGKDLFTMDYRYPLSAFQAFAICLSSFDTKLACE